MAGEPTAFRAAGEVSRTLRNQLPLAVPMPRFASTRHVVRDCAVPFHFTGRIKKVTVAWSRMCC
jgi:hypothetical protein